MNLARLTALVCFVATSVLAEESAVPPPPPPDTRVESAVTDIGHHLLYMRAGFDSGLFQDGHRKDFGFFYSNLDAVFGDVPAALDAARTARTLMLTGSVIYGVGMGVLIADLVIIIVHEANGTPISGNEAGLLIGTTIGGGVVGIVGGLISGAGRAKMLEAVNRYNFGVLNKHLPQDKQLDVNKLLSGVQQGPSVTLWAVRF